MKRTVILTRIVICCGVFILFMDERLRHQSGETIAVTISRSEAGRPLRTIFDGVTCAGEQSDEALWELHDLIFANQRNLTKENLATSISRFAGQVGKLDRPRFDACVATRRTSTAVEQDVALAKKQGLTGTPMLFMNGRRVENVSAAVQLRTLIRQNESGRRYFIERCHSTALTALQALNDEPQPQVDLTFGLLNLKPEPSSVST